MNPKVWGLLGLLYLGNILWGYGQAWETVSGRVLEAENRAPVPFAAVRLCTGNLGTFTNERGEFDLRIPARSRSDSLCFSSIGYATVTLAVGKVLESPHLEVLLPPADYSLETVTLEDKRGNMPDPAKWVKTSVKRIEEHFPREPFVLRGYYRDYLKGEGRYLNLFEASVEIHDPGFPYDELEDTRVYILASGYSPDWPVDTQYIASYDNQERKFMQDYRVSGYGGNEFTLLRQSDPIRNSRLKTFSFVYRLGRDFSNNHAFSLDTITYLDTVAMYQLSFGLKKSLSLAYLYPHLDIRGAVWLRARDLAFTELRYHNYPHVSARQPTYSIRVAYRPVGDKLYLSYMSMHNQFILRTQTDSSYTVKDTLYQYREFFVNAVERKAAPPPSSAILMDKFRPLPVLFREAQNQAWEGISPIRTLPLGEE